jgi:hypothetical protein
MGRQHLGHLVGVGEGGLQVRRRCEMPRPTVALGECLVGDVAHEVLEESVLPALG